MPEAAARVGIDCLNNRGLSRAATRFLGEYISLVLQEETEGTRGMIQKLNTKFTKGPKGGANLRSFASFAALVFNSETIPLFPLLSPVE